jgi:hypothetical protein
VEGRRHPAIAIGVFGHDQAVADKQPGQHRFAGNEEGLGDQAVETEHGEHEPKDAARLRPPIGARAAFRFLDRFVTGLVIQGRFLRRHQPSFTASIITMANAQG